MQSGKIYCFAPFLSLIFSLVTVHGLAQTNYSDYKQEQKDLIKEEQFNSALNNQPARAVISNGFLLVPEETYLELMSFQIDQKRDFEIEISLSFDELNRTSVGINFCNDIRWDIFNNQFYVYDFKKSKFLIRRKSHTRIKGKENNKFTIRKIGNNFYFFNNETLVGTSDYISNDLTELSKIGFIAGVKSDLDYLKVSYLLKEGEVPQNKISSPNRTNNSPDGIKPIKQEIKQGGRYYGLVIGVSKYDEPKLNLDKPEKDAEKLKEIFVKRYSFADSTTFLLLNPTRQKIISELYRLRRIISPNDNLLIFYAGHGYWDEDARQGYWWAKDAMQDDPSTWLSNSDLREQIRSIKSAHTLLISDACFSGGIFKTRSGNEIQNASKDVQILYSMPSRRAITSGTMTAVPDNSVFLEYLSKRLTENKNKFLSSQQLFDSFRAAVINNSSVVPQDGVIADTGDEGGDFIFILKED